jgi:phosphate butyryltransferase
VITRVSQILAEARKLRRTPRLVLVCPDNRSSLETVARGQELDLVTGILVGDRDKTMRLADEAGIDTSDMEFVEARDAQEAVDKSLSIIHAGEARVLLKGQLKTRLVLKGVLDKKYGFRTGRILSHVSVFDCPGEDRLLMLTDAGINIEPDLNKKKDIILNALDVAHALGNEHPRVAMLSFVSAVTDPRVRTLADADALVGMNQEGEIPGCTIEGPYALDVALSADAAGIKGIEGEVAGRADILVVPTADAGNILYKGMLLWCKPSPDISGTVMGTTVPMVIASRVDSVETKLNCIALAIMTHPSPGEAA